MAHHSQGGNMSPRKEDDKRVKPGILVDKELWENFKKRFAGTASQKIEELMRETLNPPAFVNTVFSSQDVNSINFNQPENWNMSFSADTISLENKSYTSSSTTNGEFSILDLKDIEIE